jgi:hypothetical protein
MSFYVEIDWPSGALKYSKYGYYFTNHQAYPLLLSITNITRVLIYSDKCENSTASIELSDHTGHFTEKLEHAQDKYCVGRKIIIWDGTMNVFTGVISENPEVKSRKCTIKIDLFYSLENTLNKQITRDEFLLVPSENEGKWGNIIYGNGSIQTGKDFIAYRIENNKYLAAWNTLSEITGAYNKDVDIISQITMSIDPTKGYTYILYTSTELEITFSGNGPTESSTLIENPARMLEALIEKFAASIIITGIDEAAAEYEAIGSFNGNSLIITDDIKLREFLTQYASDFDTNIIYTRQGTLKLKVLNWGAIEAVATPHPTLYLNFETWKDASSLFKRLQRKYAYIPAQNKYLWEPQDIAASTAYNDKLKELTQKNLVNNLTSWYIAGRYTYIYQEREEICTFELPPEFVKEKNLELGDILTVSHKKTGYTEILVQLRRESRSDKSFVKFEGTNITDLTGIECALYETGDPRNPTLTAETGPLLF